MSDEKMYLYEEMLPEDMEHENVFFHFDRQADLGRYITGETCTRLSPELLAQVKQDYLDAKASEQVVYDPEHECYTFRLSQPGADGNPLLVSICRSTRATGSPWYVKFVGKDFSGGGQNHHSCKPGDALRNFAYLGNMNGFLRDLAEHAQEETWNFRNIPDDYSILQQYIFYTFYRLQQQEKVCVAEDGSFAAFNTGLQSRRLGEDLFAYFVPNDPEQSSPWKFMCFCSTDSRDTNERRCYKNMFSSFKEPEPASYFSKITDLLFDPACEVRLSSDHIFKDNCDRLPMDFLERECTFFDEANEILQQIKAAPAGLQQKALYKDLGTVIADDPDLFSSMNERLQGALDRTVRRTRRNYKLAVPCFFPSRNVMSMMLPLSFTSMGTPALVLVCERTRSGSYLGQTILTLPMAYINARLLCRPGSEWLNTRQIVAQETPELAEECGDEQSLW